jgi:hypothetical protein
MLPMLPNGLSDPYFYDIEESGMDAHEANRKQQRELGLLLIGAMLADKTLIPKVTVELDPHDAGDEQICTLLTAIKDGRGSDVWKGLARLGVERKDATSSVDAILAALKTATAKRAAIRMAAVMRLSAMTSDPGEWLRDTKEQIKEIEAKL